MSAPNAIQERLLGWYAAHRRDLPWRNTSDPYAILVAEIMLQQTQVARVVPKYTRFLEQFPTWKALAEASPGTVIRAWEGLGYNRRAVRLQATARQVLERFGGHLPRNAHQLEKLDGVGRYTAAAVACFAFGIPTPVVDTNVRRVLGRVLFGPRPVPERDITSAARSLLDGLPNSSASSWAQALMDLGATVCTHVQPRCSICPLRNSCVSASTFQQLQGKTVAESPASYRPRQTPFRDSSRYYRGRIIQHLRALPPGETIGLGALGTALRSDLTRDDLPWLRQMVAQLHQEGLVYLDEMESTVEPEEPDRVRVRLP
ncbi:MAG: A/G-specific adenine glycosylase [Chloroflexi bacterium]|nr:A/G-specific adenine glycosylase [Chloroflexota bacterium]